MRQYIFLFTLLSLVSCSDNYIFDTEYKAPVFKQTYTADVKTIHGGYLFDPISTMYIWNDYFIIKTKSIDNKCEFQVLSTSDGHQITGFGFKGRGENELSSFTNSNINPQNGYITVADYDGKIALYNIDNIIKTGSPNPEQCYKLPRFPRGKVMQLNGKLVHLESVPRIFMTNMQCVDTVGTIRKIPAISPEIDKDSIDKMMYYVHSSKWAARPDGKKLCNFTRNGMIMEIYDINSSTITPTTLRYFYEPKMVSCRAGRADDSCIVGACSVSATNEYIYTASIPIRFAKIPKLLSTILGYSIGKVVKYADIRFKMHTRLQLLQMISVAMYGAKTPTARSIWVTLI